MRLATVTQDGKTKVVTVASDGRTFRPLEESLGRPVPDMISLIERFDEIRTLIEPDGAIEGGTALASVRLEAPIPRPARNVFCVGKNYHEHAHEFARSGFDSSASTPADAVPTAPIIFTKAPECVIADGDDIRYPAGVSDSLDYEAELGVVIGRGGRGIAKARAYDHVFGYTIINDVTARDLQGRHKQWFLGKSLDTFCPMGPWLSAGMTLRPGDVIATGTPVGVGIGFTPPKFLQRGDRVTVEIQGLGRLSNKVA